MSPRLSVIVPVHDGAHTLEACLDALLAQLPEDAELIVVNDASTDGTAGLLEGRLLEAGRAEGAVRVLTNAERLGPSASRDRGWRASTAPLLAFVDADVALRPGALEALLGALEASPELLGANGLLDLQLSTPGLVTAFTNTSIHYQHLRHGARVATSFTSLCVLRREALVAMGGWDLRWTSRYADDVATRFQLPPACLGLARAALGDHLKPVRLRGLLKHRRNIGHHWVHATLANLDALRARPKVAVLDRRFPMNTLAGALLLALPGAALVGGPPLLLAGALGASALLLAANAGLVAFTWRHRGGVEALLVVPLSAVEGLGCAGGAIAATLMAPVSVRPTSPHSPGAPRESA